MKKLDRERMEKELRPLWEKFLTIRDEAQSGMEAISALKAKLVSEELDELRKGVSNV